MYNLISGLVIAGLISASGAAYLTEIKQHSEEATEAYVKATEKRFKIYDEMLPGLVEFPEKTDKQNKQ